MLSYFLNLVHFVEEIRLGLEQMMAKVVIELKESLCTFVRRIT